MSTRIPKALRPPHDSLNAHFAKARADERRKIVAFLRANRERWIDEAAGDDRTTADHATDAVERGDHDEEPTP